MREEVEEEENGDGMEKEETGDGDDGFSFFVGASSVASSPSVYRSRFLLVSSGHTHIHTQVAVALSSPRSSDRRHRNL
nr:hypothetical protein R07G3.4 - Caenorhabditis elegans [Caenorhabditis elegans]